MLLFTTCNDRHDWKLLLQATLANADVELEDADLDVADLPAPALPAAATTGGDAEKAKKKRKVATDEAPEASGSKSPPASPQVGLVLKQTLVLHNPLLSCLLAE